MLLSEDIQNKLRCPSTKAKLTQNENYLVSEIDTNIRYPIIDGIPILINNKNSLFSIDDYIKKKSSTSSLHVSKVKKLIRSITPGISTNIKAKENYSALATLLPHSSKILIIGGSIKGYGMESLYSNESYELVGSDVSFGPYTKVISDAHDIPFEDEIFDCVIAQAVLEHVLDPHRCADEIYRVLKPFGIVYAEVPFMQQVHMRQYDFTRFTHLGFRKLFGHFEEIKSGPCCGPGMALAWAYTYFLRSFAESAQTRDRLTLFAYFTSFFFKYFDYYLINKPGSYDAASGCYFMGRKSDKLLSNSDLIKEFKGV